MKTINNIGTYLLVVVLFSIFTLGVTGGLSTDFSGNDILVVHSIVISFWGLIWLPLLKMGR